MCVCPFLGSGRTSTRLTLLILLVLLVLLPLLLLQKNKSKMFPNQISGAPEALRPAAWLRQAQHYLTHTARLEFLSLLLIENIAVVMWDEMMMMMAIFYIFVKTPPVISLWVRRSQGSLRDTYFILFKEIYFVWDIRFSTRKGGLVIYIKKKISCKL